MIVVADASVLVGELLRQRGRALLLRSDLRVVVAEEQWREAEHELRKRVGQLAEARQLTRRVSDELLAAALGVVEAGAVEVVPANAYCDLEPVARSRVPRDPKDWPTVALALVLQVGILTGDKDFLGCGCPTWTVETLTQELERLAQGPQISG